MNLNILNKTSVQGLEEAKRTLANQVRQVANNLFCEVKEDDENDPGMQLIKF